MAVILIRPVISLWYSRYIGYSEKSAVGIAIYFAVSLLLLLACALLGANRNSALVSATFVYSIINVLELPGIFFILEKVHPLLAMPDITSETAQIQLLFFFGSFFFNVIVAFCCFLAARLLRKATVNPPLKLSVIFCLIFISFTVIIYVWLIDASLSSISFLTFAILGLLMVGMQILTFYFFTQVTVNKTSILPDMQKTTNEANTVRGDYAQFVPLLSKREMEVIEAVLAGAFSYKKIAASLNISVNTVKTHLQHIYQTTGVSSIDELSSLFRGFSENHP
jgi:DNA-binding CsgD family transcriptional regulator